MTRNASPAPVRLTARGEFLAWLVAAAVTYVTIRYGVPAVLRFGIMVDTLTTDAVTYLTPAAPVLVPLLIAGPAWLALLTRDARNPR